MFATNEIEDIKNNNKLIKKFVKSKITKLSKSQKLKGKKSAKLKNLSKSDNLSKFNAKKFELSFLISTLRLLFIAYN